MTKWRSLTVALGSLMAVAVLIGVSIVWPGLDVRETPEVNASVWVLQSGEGRKYARVNTAIGELDTVRSVGNPSAVAQGADGAYLFSESFGKVTRINESLPQDVDEQTLEQSASTPPGTIEMRLGGDYAVYRTDTGAVFAGRLGADAPTQIGPFSDDPDARQYTSDAIAVSPGGVIYSYSSRDAEVLQYSIDQAQVLQRDPSPAGDDIDSPAVTGVGERWMLVDLDSGQAWLRGESSPIDTGTGGGRVLAQASADGEAFYIADDAGLVEIGFDAEVVRVHGVGTQTRGTPARPVWFDGTLYAAWLPREGAGVLWSSTADPVPLDFGGSELPDQRRPAFVTGTGSIVLNESRSGWVWTVPDGRLVPSSQDWTLDDRIDSTAPDSETVAPVVVDPRPPVAEPDSFGVRPGALAALPVLLNDHDPNTDVLSIDPASVTALDPSFGTVTITDSRQRLAVQVADGAQGTATFSYRVTDGTTETGLYSEPTTVTLTAVTDNAAPEWCGVDGCLAQWPEPQVAVGGTISVPVLHGWVDPDGDPLLLLSVENRSGVGVAVGTPSGDVVYQHSDDGTGANRTVELAATVADAYGATTTKHLTMRVTDQPTLAVQSFTVVDTLSGGLTVDVGPHVTGTGGTLSLSQVRVLDDEQAVAIAQPGGMEFDFTTSTPGTYRVSFSVTDGRVTETGIARITILANDAPAQLATSPVVAFVHPREDATVNVFAAVTNPTRRVLLLSDVQTLAAPGATLSVDAVGQQFLRVSGTTADGNPGRLGVVRYVVSDGTDDLGARVTGEAVVYLLPPALDIAPIAVDDTVVVRAGAQIDIPVLENDVAPSGSGAILDPASIRSSSAEALAFASGDMLRYLAPTEPGTYAIEYSTYATGAPSLADTASVTVTVVSADANRAPIPDTLEGRVLIGQSTTIAFDPVDVDPDGDPVVLDRIVDQPSVGAASISADGSSILYTSAAGPGASGQQSFTYQVADAFGETGIGVVRVGVLDAEANPSPVTFTDYVQLQVGEDSSVRVDPLTNDVDPTGGALTLVEVRPDIPATLEDGEPSAEFARLDRMISTVTETSVVITAGSAPGTMGFLYDVRSDSGNTARGLIVVKVVREAVPNYPRVADTLLTAQTRDQFERGVDVVTDKITWTGGDVNDLTLGLWGEPAGVATEGRSLSGALTASPRVIPFSVTGDGADGEVTTYGFLRIPGADSVHVSLRAGVVPQPVDEAATVTFDMRDLVGIPRGRALEVGAVSPSGSRAEAQCSVAGGTSVRYDAGYGAPWVDTCHVAVRLVGTDAWAVLAVPIRVVPLEPQPMLRSGALTIGPGESYQFDLRELTTWQGPADDANLVYRTSYTGTRFTLLDDNGLLTITGADAAMPGTEDVVTIEIVSHGPVAPARLNLRVGAAPSNVPKAGTVSQTCSQADGLSCVIPVVGAPGELNPLPRTPMTLAEVSASGVCVGVTFTVESAQAVRASWTADAPGATCTATFTVRDAQGRHTSGARNGTVMLDLLGFPTAPASIAQVTYADQQIGLRVDPGTARAAYPRLLGFTVRHEGTVVAECDAAGVCPTITAPNGDERVYEVVAVNDVGESRSAVRTSAWAYNPPDAPAAITTAPIPTVGGEGGRVLIEIGAVDAVGTGHLEVSSPVGETLQVPIAPGETSVSIPNFWLGANEPTPITITPHSRFPVPAGLSGLTSGSAVTVSAAGIGAPQNPALTLTSTPTGSGQVTVQAAASATSGGPGSTLRYGIVADGQRCQTGVEGTEATFTGLPDGQEYRYAVCVESWFGGSLFGRATATASVRAAQPTTPPEGYTFVVDPTPDVTDGSAIWRIRDLPTSTTPLPNRNVAEFRGGPPSSVMDAPPGIQVRYRHELWGTVSEWATVTPRAGSAPHQVWTRWGVSTCVGGGQLEVHASSSFGLADHVFLPREIVYYDAAGAVLSHEPGTWTVPVGAVRVEGISVTVGWPGTGWGLEPVRTTLGGTCDPNNPPPPPLPTPEETSP